MAKFMAGIVAALVAACVSPNNAEPKIVSTVSVQEPTVKTEPDSYLVRLNFVVFEDEIAKSPNITIAFNNALAEWVHNLPLECAVYCEKPSMFLFTPFEPDKPSSQPGIVVVHIVDINAAPYSMPFGVLGYWSHKDNMLVLDKNVLENDPEEAYMVALHELGHVFGLPHFVNVKSQQALTGWYVIPNDFDASKMVMYPLASDANRTSKLTQLEIELAKENLSHLQQMMRADCFHLTAP